MFGECGAWALGPMHQCVYYFLAGAAGVTGAEIAGLAAGAVAFGFSV
jgi:hypothetical protein